MVKSKVRFDGLDVAAMASYLKCVALGRRIINIYNGPNGETYVFKLDKNNTNNPLLLDQQQSQAQQSQAQDSSQQQQQELPTNTSTTSTTNTPVVSSSNLLLILESGLRFHTTEQSYENPGMPTPFCSKLRKHLRGLRLEHIQQLGLKDRVVMFTFGSGDKQRHSIILELYARGNIILVNSQYEIVALLRSHEYDNVKVKVGYVYPVTYATTMTTMTTITTTTSEAATNDLPVEESSDKDTSSISNATEEITTTTTTTTAVPSTLLTSSNPMEWFQQQQQQQNEPSSTIDETNTTTKKKKKGSGAPAVGSSTVTTTTTIWRKLLSQSISGVSHYGPSLLDHCILCASLETTLPETLDYNGWITLQSTLQEQGDIILTSLENGTAKGYILYQLKKVKDNDDDEETTKQELSVPTVNTPVSPFEDKLLLEFQPHLLKQHELSIASTSIAATATTSSSSITSNDTSSNTQNNNNQKKKKGDNGIENYYYLEYDTFDRAVDIFFGHIEEQKRLLRVEHQQVTAQQRLDKIKQDQEQRVQSLLQAQEVLKQQAQIVELNSINVDQAIQVINSALDSGMDWEQLQDLIHLEQTQNLNPIALLIQKIDFEQDSILLRLPTTITTNEDEEDDDALHTFENASHKKDVDKQQQEQDKPDDTSKGEEEVQNDDNSSSSLPKFMDIPISLKETAHGNASALFARYRANKVKSQKTIEASTKALQAAEETAQRQLQDAQNRKHHLSSTIAAKRKALWFEKFHWFITSDNYLVIAGRDAQQNEQLVKRYLRPGDAYLHADVHGAASCILRAKRARAKSTGHTGTKKGDVKTIPLPLSDQALKEAGNFTICKSSAWTSRMVTSAWWVESHQVSKTAPTGEYLTVGSFMIRGKKNFLPPSPLEMGLGVLFRLGDDEGITRHKNERRDFAMMAELERQEAEDALNDEESMEKDDEKKNKNKVVKDGAVEKQEKNVEAPKIDELPVVNEGEPITSEGAEPSVMPVLVEKEMKDEHDDGHEHVLNDNEQSNRTDDRVADAIKSHGENPGNNMKKKDKNLEARLQQEVPKKKKGLSVKERKLIKKYGSLEAAMEAEEERKKAEDDQQTIRSFTNSVISEADNNADSNNGTRKRGKKGRSKKMMKKYADQDEEDRELAMMALHGGEKIKGKDKDKKKVAVTSETEKQAAAETMAILKKDSAKVAESIPDEVRKLLGACVTVKSGGDGNNAPAGDGGDGVVRWDKFDADVLEQLQSLDREEEKVAAAQRLLNLKNSTRIDNFSASLAGIIRTIRKYGHKNILENNAGVNEDGKRKTKAEKEAQDSAWKQTMAEEGIVDEDGIDEDVVDDTVELSKLTGKPHPDDLILYAVPVCAPYQTLSQYAYRVKLTPGNQKRGKASKQCVDIFIKGDGPSAKKTPANDRNKDLMKKVGDNEWVQAICADVKISAAGASKMQKKQKANKKK